MHNYIPVHLFIVYKGILLCCLWAGVQCVSGAVIPLCVCLLSHRQSAGNGTVIQFSIFQLVEVNQLVRGIMKPVEVPSFAGDSQQVSGAKTGCASNWLVTLCSWICFAELTWYLSIPFTSISSSDFFILISSFEAGCNTF